MIGFLKKSDSDDTSAFLETLTDFQPGALGAAAQKKDHGCSAYPPGATCCSLLTRNNWKRYVDMGPNTGGHPT